MRARAVLGVVALVLLAGCSGGVPFLGGGDAGGNGGGNATTTTATEPGTAAKPYAAPLNGTAVLDGHVERLRAGANFTYVESTSLTAAGGLLGEFGGNRTVRVNLTSGAVLARSGDAGQRRTVYRTPNGTVYVRVQQTANGSTGSRYPDPRYYGTTVNRSRLTRPPVLRSLGDVNTSYAGTETVDGTTVHVYEASGTEALAAGALGGPESVNVSGFTLRVGVTDQGLVKSHLTAIESKQAGQTVSVTASGTVSRVGNTTVPRPAWLDDARAARANDSDAPAVRNVTVTDDDAGATLTAAVPADAGDAIALAPAQNERYYTVPVEAARVGPVVRLSLPDETRRAETTLVLSYRETLVPEGDERALTVRRFSLEYADSQPATGNVTVDPARNQVRVRGVDPGTTAVVLVHGPTFEHERKAQAAES